MWTCKCVFMNNTCYISVFNSGGHGSHWAGFDGAISGKKDSLEWMLWDSIIWENIIVNFFWKNNWWLHCLISYTIFSAALDVMKLCGCQNLETVLEPLIRRVIIWIIHIHCGWFESIFMWENAYGTILTIFGWQIFFTLRFLCRIWYPRLL